MTRAERLAGERLSKSEAAEIGRRGITKPRQIVKAVSLRRIPALNDDDELSTAECAFFLCHSRNYVGEMIRSGLLPARRITRSDGSPAYRVEGRHLRALAEELAR